MKWAIVFFMIFFIVGCINPKMEGIYVSENPTVKDTMYIQRSGDYNQYSIKNINGTFTGKQSGNIITTSLAFSKLSIEYLENEKKLIINIEGLPDSAIYKKIK